MDRRQSDDLSEQLKQELDLTSLLLETAHSLAEGRAPESVLDRLCAKVLRAVSHKRVNVSLCH